MINRRERKEKERESVCVYCGLFVVFFLLSVCFGLVNSVNPVNCGVISGVAVALKL
jgi:hypothetical protein